MNRIRMHYQLHAEFWNYCIVGVSATILTLGIYFTLVHTVLSPMIPLEMQLANIISWFLGVLVSYLANRTFVFHSKNPHILREAGGFFFSRIVALLMDMAVMFLMVTKLRCMDEAAKAVSTVVQTVSNYFFSKFLVFQEKQRKRRDDA